MNQPSSQAQGVDWKLLFHQLFATEINKERVLTAPVEPRARRAALERQLRAHTAYYPTTFNDAIERICAAGSSNAAYEARREIVCSAAGRRAIFTLALDRCVPAELWRLPPVRALLTAIGRAHDRPAPADESFYATPEGQAVLEAFRYDGGANNQQVALLLVPGYAAHTIKHTIFEETVREANVAFGRPAERPLRRESGIDLEFEPHATFYRRGSAGSAAALDVLHPMGQELGNTTGSNREMTAVIARWIAALPAAYRQKKLLLLGYSKGAPVVFELARQHPELRARVLAYVTFCGVVQGTHVARQALQRAELLLRDVPLGDFVDRLRAIEPQALGRQLSPLLAHLDLRWLSVPRIRRVLDALGYDAGPLQQQVDRVLDGRELREVLDGWRDLTPLERARWNLRWLNNKTFTEPTAIFNLSALTDIKDFVRPGGGLADDGSAVAPSLIAPTLTATGGLDWRDFSLDALFLYLTSIEGFKSAPGGLFDTQVELAHSKTPLLDRRPLSASLTDAELQALWRDEAVRTVATRAGVASFGELCRTPRCALWPAARRSNIEAFDLGEFRGHHWSLFVQALRPPRELSDLHAAWDFPRRALMRALLQSLALYNLLSPTHGRGS